MVGKGLTECSSFQNSGWNKEGMNHATEKLADEGSWADIAAYSPQ